MTGKIQQLSSVLQKPWIIIWVRRIRLKLTFSQVKLCANFGKFNILVKTTVKFRNAEINKILNTNANRVFPVAFKIMYISLRCMHSLKNNPAVYGSGYLYEVNQKFSVTNAFVFSDLKALFWNIKKEIIIHWYQNLR